jgi:hypothetical protein
MAAWVPIERVSVPGSRVSGLREENQLILGSKSRGGPCRSCRIGSKVGHVCRCRPQVNNAGAKTPGELADEKRPTCKLGRKRLWVEGEGWVVRRVRTRF